MENFLPYNYKEIRFIKIFYNILLIFLAILCVCFFIIRINDTAKVLKGEIISETPTINYVTPFEATPFKTFYSPGDAVKKGDTLMVIVSSDIQKEANKVDISNVSNEQQLDVLEYQILKRKEKISFFKVEKKLARKEYLIETEKLKNTILSVTEKEKSSKERLLVKESRLAADSSLYKKGIISLFNLRTSVDEYHGFKSLYVESKNQIKLNQNALSGLKNNFFQKENDLNIKLSNIEENLKELENTRNKLILELSNIKQNSAFLQKELEKQFLIAKADGIVSYVYNVKNEYDYLREGEVLIKISPKDDDFYAKISVSDMDVKYLKLGQRVNIKLDNYYYYEYGIVKGEISHIPERKEDEFYILVKIPKDIAFTIKSGYTLEGEIILEEMSLFSFVIKKLFNKRDSKV